MIQDEIMKLQTYKMFEGEDTVYVERDDVLEVLKQQPCEDCISRQAIDDAIYDYSRSCDVNYQQIMEFIEKIPPVTPQQKIGWWIEQIDQEENCRTLICSNCDRPALHDEDSIWKHKYCPHCGARMVEPKESEE